MQMQSGLWLNLSLSWLVPSLPQELAYLVLDVLSLLVI